MASKPQTHSTDRSLATTMLDFRSDTVTLPTPEMRRAMAEAEVGDDVYGEDPAVNRLEERAAQIFKKEAALFVPSGTMGNQIAIKCHTRPGQEIICEELAHIFNFEMAMLAHFSGCLARTIAAEDGILSWQQISARIAPKVYYRAPTGLIALENTHNFAGGTVYPQAVCEEICNQAHEMGIPVHLDGARVFNAATALRLPVHELAAPFDSVMVCLSKGLGAPVGSLLLGTQAFMEQARAYRKALGGGMRQAGILAAAGLIALEEGPRRLHEDHANAQFLASHIARLSGLRIDAARVQTNILVFEISGSNMSASDAIRKLAQRNLLVSSVNERVLRMVTHKDVDHAACERACEILASVFSSK